jgi:hypothetical protein
MAVCRINLCWDDQRHNVVDFGLKHHAEANASAYIRKCIEFYEMNKANTSQSAILENLLEIKRMLLNGAVIATGQQPEDDNDELFDDLLEQMG